MYETIFCSKKIIKTHLWIYTLQLSVCTEYRLMYVLTQTNICNLITLYKLILFSNNVYYTLNTTLVIWVEVLISSKNPFKSKVDLNVYLCKNHALVIHDVIISSTIINHEKKRVDRKEKIRLSTDFAHPRARVSDV